MKYAATLTVVLLAGCASSGGGPQDAGLTPEMFAYEYEYRGKLGPKTVAGRFSFEDVGGGDVLYTVVSEGGAMAPCREYVRTADRRLRLRCGGLILELTRSEDGLVQSHGTLNTSELVSQQECREWRVDERTRRRVCVAYHTVQVENPVTYRGSVDIFYAVSG